MNDVPMVLPGNYAAIKEASEQISFTMPSDLQTGSLLTTLITSKPGAHVLELGTGTGLSLSWIVMAMDKDAQVISIDTNETYLSVARQYYSGDTRVTILCEDAGNWIRQNHSRKFDLVFADSWPGKYTLLDETLSLLKPGGFYVIDDMLPQSNWPEGHGDNVNRLVVQLESRRDIRLTRLNWSTGILIAAKIN